MWVRLSTKYCRCPKTQVRWWLNRTNRRYASSSATHSTLSTSNQGCLRKKSRTCRMHKKALSNFGTHVKASTWAQCSQLKTWNGTRKYLRRMNWSIQLCKTNLQPKWSLLPLKTRSTTSSSRHTMIRRKQSREQTSPDFSRVMVS